MQIRSERPGEGDAIHALTRAAFVDAPHSSHTEQYIVDALRRAGALAVSLVAEDADGIVGHVALSKVQLSDGSPGWYGLGPISVAPGRQGQGVGSALMRAAVEALRARGAAGCVLLGIRRITAGSGSGPNRACGSPGCRRRISRRCSCTAGVQMQRWSITRRSGPRADVLSAIPVRSPSVLD